jgi:hypothetical protein
MVAIVGVDSFAKRTIVSLLEPNVYFAKDIDDAISHLSRKKRYKTDFKKTQAQQR